MSLSLGISHFKIFSKDIYQTPLIICYMNESYTLGMIFYKRVQDCLFMITIIYLFIFGGNYYYLYLA